MLLMHERSICGRNPILLAMQTLSSLPSPHTISFICYAQSSECAAVSGACRTALFSMFSRMQRGAMRAA